MSTAPLVAYAVYTDMIGDTSQASGTFAQVMNDATNPALNGYYEYSSGVWTRVSFPSRTVYADDYVLSTDAGDYALAINRAILAVAPTVPGYGVVELSRGNKTIKAVPIYLRQGVTVRGQGRLGTILTAHSSATGDLFQTLNFPYPPLPPPYAAKWLVSNPVVVYGFGLEQLTIDGNNAVGVNNGISIYGKNFRIDDVIVANCVGYGLYTECGDGVGGTTYLDLAQTSITNLCALNNGLDGILNQGPHDAVWDNIFCCGNGGWGMEVLSSSGNYDGTCVLGNIHTFNNGTASGAAAQVWGLNANVGIRDGACWILEDGGMLAGNNNMVAEIWLALGSKPGYQLAVSGTGSSIGSIQGIIKNSSQNGVSITGAQTRIGQIYLDVTGTGNGNGVGLLIDASNVTVAGGVVRNFSDSGGRCLQIGTPSGSTQSGLDINLTLQAGSQNILISTSPVASNIKLTSINVSTSHIDTSSVALDMVSNDVNVWCGIVTGGTHFCLRREGLHGFRTFGNGNATSYWYGNETTLYFNVPLTANRTVTLSTTVPSSTVTLVGWKPPVGSRFRTVRSAAATGAFNLTVGTKVLGSAGMWVDHEFDGTAWQVVAAGNL